MKWVLLWVMAVSDPPFVHDTGLKYRSYEACAHAGKQMFDSRDEWTDAGESVRDEYRYTKIVRGEAVSRILQQKLTSLRETSALMEETIMTGDGRAVLTTPDINGVFYYADKEVVAGATGVPFAAIEIGYGVCAPVAG